MMQDRNNKPIIRLKDKCRGRFPYPTSEEAAYQACYMCNGCRSKDPIEKCYEVPTRGYVSEGIYNNMRSCIIVFSINHDFYSNGREHHSYSCENDQWYVKSFKNNKLVKTRNEDEAYQFFTDKEVDECMEYILSHECPWTIADWEFKGNTIVSECVHYPNEYWGVNGCLQPSLMNKSVNEWLKEHNKTE